MTDAEKKSQYLSDIDAILQSRSFHRRKNGNHWRHQMDDRNELWININFGKAVVNPSFGVTYLDFESRTGLRHPTPIGFDCFRCYLRWKVVPTRLVRFSNCFWLNRCRAIKSFRGMMCSQALSSNSSAVDVAKPNN